MENEVTQYLDKRGIAYEVWEHKAVYTMAEAETLDLATKGIVPKNLLLKEKKSHRRFLVTTAEKAPLEIKELRSILGTKELCFCSTEELMELLGLEKGSLTVFGILNDIEHRVEVILDCQMQGKIPIGLHPNTNTATLWLTYDDLKKVLTSLGNPFRELKLPTK